MHPQKPLNLSLSLSLPIFFYFENNNFNGRISMWIKDEENKISGNPFHTLS